MDSTLVKERTEAGQYPYVTRHAEWWALVKLVLERGRCMYVHTCVSKIKERAVILAELMELAKLKRIDKFSLLWCLLSRHKHRASTCERLHVHACTCMYMYMYDRECGTCRTWKHARDGECVRHLWTIQLQTKLESVCLKASIVCHRSSIRNALLQNMQRRAHACTCTYSIIIAYTECTCGYTAHACTYARMCPG